MGCNVYDLSVPGREDKDKERQVLWLDFYDPIVMAWIHGEHNSVIICQVAREIPIP